MSNYSENQVVNTAGGRITFVDYIRVVACFFVMLVHASENFYGADASGIAGNMSMVANEANRFWVAFWDGGVARTCVPLFMIVSAFLLVPLKPGQTMASFYKRRAWRILPPFIFFLLAYTFLPLLWGGMTWEQSVADLKRLPFNFPSMGGHLWFMYPLLSLYLIMPVMAAWLEKATGKEERIFLGIFAFSTLMPWLHRYVSPELWGECFWNEYHMLWYCSGYIGYLVMGHYIRFHIHWGKAKRVKVGLCCFLLGAFFTGWSFWLKGTPGQPIETMMLEWSWEFCTPNVLLATFGLFVAFSAIEGKAPKIITELSKLSFGMFLMHLFFLAPIAKFFVNGDKANPLIPVALAIPAIAICTFICCAVTTKLLTMLPGSKHMVGA